MLVHLRSANYYLLELYIFLKALSTALTTLTLSLLVQDKICLLEYNETTHYCAHINKQQIADHSAADRNHILAEATTFGNYKNLLECIPMVLWSLFIGSFLDHYKSGTRIVLLVAVFGDLFTLASYLVSVLVFDLSKYFLLVGSLSIWFTGGLTSYLTTIYSYIAVNSDETIRPIKFMLVRFSNIMGMSAGTFIGGHLISIIEESGGTEIHRRPLRTYYRNFGLAVLLDVTILAILLGLFRLTKRGREPENTEPESNSQNFCRTFFKLDNFYQTVACFLQHRPGHTRLQIHLLYLVLVSQVLIFFGINDVLLQFCEKVYQWDAGQYANLAALSKVGSTGLLALSSLLLVKHWAIADGTIIWLALCSSFASELIIGTFLSPLAYYISIPIGALSGFSLISIRSKLSKLVPSEQIAKVLSLSSTLEAVIPFAASFIYSNLFAATIAWYPSAIYHFSTTVVLGSLVVMLFEEFY